MTAATEHDELLPLLAGEALGGLDDAEAARLAAHRAHCDRCAADTLELAELGVDLALIGPTHVPSPDLRARIMATTQPAGATPSTDAGRQRDERGIRGFRGLFRRPAVALTALGLAGLLVVATVIGAADRSRLDRQVAEQAALIAVLADPGHARAPLESKGDPNIVASAVYLPGTTDSFVVATGLPATPADHVYQLWSADGAGLHPLGTFTFDGRGTFIAPFGVDLSSADAAMITLEPTGGVTGDPGPQVVFGELTNPAP